MMEPIKEEVHSRETLCRICASCTQLLIPIFEGEGLENNISEKIHKYLPIQLSSEDGLPDQVCFHCASTVLSWHELTATCVEAEIKLKAMFGEHNADNEIKLPSEDLRDSSADINEDIPDDLETHDDFAESDPSNLRKNHQGQVSMSSKQERFMKAPKEGEKERFIADVTEDIGISDICMEVEEENLSIRDIQVASQFDHSYSQGRPAVNQSMPKPPGNCSSSRSIVHHSAPRPILPRPQVNFVPTPPITRKPKEMTNISSKSKVYVVLNRKGTGQSVDENAVVAVPINQLQKTSSSSIRPILFKPLNRPQPLSLPETTKPVRVPVTLPAQPKAPPPDVLRMFPALKDVTISRVLSDGSKEVLKKPPPKASVSVLRGGNYTCKLCSHKFSNEMVYKRHMFLSHNIKKHNCPFCKTVFGKKLDLDFHIRQMHRRVPVKSIPECKLCKETFDKMFDLRCHTREKHTITISRFEQVIRDRKKILGVAITDKEVEMLREFHSRVDNKDVYNCKMCNKSWVNLDKTVAHIRTHTKELLYPCETCGQRFNTRGVMVRHLQVHKNVKPYSCEYCDKSFSSKQNRDDHHRQHTKEVKTVCESCGEFLTSASMLYYHRKIHSGINPYKCPYCDKAYSIRSLLKRHIRFHTGEKPHLCSVCGRGFKTSGQLRGHSAVHSDARPFSCDGCGATMKTKKYLLRHRAICSSIKSKQARDSPPLLLYLQEMKLVGITKKLMCHICNIEFSDSSSLAKHMNCVHESDTKSLDEVATGTDSAGDAEAKNHMLFESNASCANHSQICQSCGRFFRHLTILKMHSVSCKKLHEMFDCSSDYCDYVTVDGTLEFKDIANPDSHRKYFAKRGAHSSYGSSFRQSHSEKSKKTYSADNSGEALTNSGRHSSQTADKKNKRVSCAYCIKSFVKTHDAILHVRKSHPTKLEEFLGWLQRRKHYLKDKVCPVCDKAYMCTEEAASHSCQKEGSGILWACELCSLICINEEDLLKHIASHSALEDNTEAFSVKDVDRTFLPSNKEVFDSLPEVLSSGILVTESSIDSGEHEIVLNNFAHLPKELNTEGHISGNTCVVNNSLETPDATNIPTLPGNFSSSQGSYAVGTEAIAGNDENGIFLSISASHEGARF